MTTLNSRRQSYAMAPIWIIERGLLDEWGFEEKGQGKLLEG